MYVNSPARRPGHVQRSACFSYACYNAETFRERERERERETYSRRISFFQVKFTRPFG